ncbi:sodium/potassium/calcium exchanger 3-like isoform X1 [Nymphalis io]|uniref:sodium/potassium/calcium exchanger 3-like isoform X1 n=1 Tax=Inachis io TaxID=171585 RepID=UPI00216A63E0|nr:sodium/potassium/calcium exchanger 3-like isoform X1 [Nymphalis io]
MATMLLRTSSACKYRVAVLVRVLFFFSIPLLYFILNDNKSVVVNDIDSADDYVARPARHLLALVDIPTENCTPPAILEFPSDGLTRFHRQHGFILIHCLLAVYCFLLLGTVCEQYFVPAIEIICERLNMEADIAGATFMAAASSSPELFINCIGTFVTEGDLGVGAIVGSAVFNVLAVPACCALVAGRVIELDWWSVSRDCMMYAVAVVALILTLLDDKIYWHEALLLVLMYTFYILAMVYNGRLGDFAKSGCCYINKKKKTYTEISPLLVKDKKNPLEASHLMIHSNQNVNDIEQGVVITKRHNSTDSECSTSSVWSWPDEKSSNMQKLFWVITWPMGLLLWATIPDCRKHQRLYFLTFIMCVTWIAGVSYLVAWIITIIGDTLNVPDSITGLTILAAGTSLPEAVSSVLVTNQGHGTMGISNSIGSNTFDILLCLGLPWLIKSLFYPSYPDNHWVKINSSGLSYSAVSLLSTLIALYGSLALNKFQLDWKVGITCALVYAGFLLMAALIELNILFVVNLPTCPHL